MNSTPESEWKRYYSATRNRPPRRLLLRALEHIDVPGQALDIGAGALNESRALLDAGFEVTAIDGAPGFFTEAATIQNQKFHPITTSFEGWEFPTAIYTLAVAMYALPFNSPQTFQRVFDQVIASLVPGGIFVGQLFGLHDDWRIRRPDMIFHSREQVDTLFYGLEIISLEEVEEDKPTATGPVKHWHIFHIIARKK